MAQQDIIFLFFHGLRLIPTTVYSPSLISVVALSPPQCRAQPRRRNCAFKVIGKRNLRFKLDTKLRLRKIFILIIKCLLIHLLIFIIIVSHPNVKYIFCVLYWWHISMVVGITITFKNALVKAPGSSVGVPCLAQGHLGCAQEVN